MMNVTASRHMECHECGQLHDVPPVTSGARVQCVQCDGVLLRYRAEGLSRSAAFNLAAGLFFCMSLSQPIMTIEIAGRQQVASLLTGIASLWSAGMWELSVLVAVTTIGAPGIRLVLLTMVFADLGRHKPARFISRLYAYASFLNSWAMIEIYILGLFVAYVKLLDLAHVEISPGFWFLAAQMIATIATTVSIDRQTIWSEFERRNVAGKSPTLDPGQAYCRCHVCGLTANVHSPNQRCPRCDFCLCQRKANSLNRTWALVIAAIILYFPANIYPVMTVIMFGKGEPHTILNGVVELAQAGMVPLAALVFFASVVVPVLKISSLIFLLLCARRGTKAPPRHHTSLYRIVEFIGPWSMIDIFMTSILVALVQLGAVATIAPGIGAISFAAVVILTMFAARSFDTRLLWDRQQGTSVDKEARAVHA